MKTKNNAEFQLKMHDIEYIKLSSDIYYVPIANKPPAMTWTKWQFIVKYIALHNQNNKCICEKLLKYYGELHHALLTRADVQGNKKSHLVHDLLNVIVLCKDCHDTITRLMSAEYLVDLYGYDEIKNWYDGFPMTTKKVEFDYYLENK